MLERAGFEKGGQAVVLGGATIAGFFAAACSLPFDFVKTRIQKMEPLPDGTLPYKGPVDCALKTLREEGFLKFYTGFPTYCVRCGPLSAARSMPTSLLRMKNPLELSSKLPSSDTALCCMCHGITANMLLACVRFTYM